MNTTEIRPAKSDSEIQDIAILAEEIWHQHFTPIIGKEQVDYMVDKFQSYPAIKAQIEHDGYEYFQIYRSHAMAGYTGKQAVCQKGIPRMPSGNRSLPVPCKSLP